MYFIEVHDQIIKVFSVFYFMGFWHYDNWSVFRKWSIKIVQLGILACYPLSFAIGTYISEDMNEKYIYLSVQL